MKSFKKAYIHRKNALKRGVFRGFRASLQNRKAIDKEKLETHIKLTKSRYLTEWRLVCRSEIKVRTFFRSNCKRYKGMLAEILKAWKECSENMSRISSNTLVNIKCITRLYTPIGLRIYRIFKAWKRTLQKIDCNRSLYTNST